MVVTLHGRIDLPEVQKLLDIFQNVQLVSISEAHRKDFPDWNYVRTIQHGGLPDSLPLGDASGGYLAFLHRISRERRPDSVIRIAQSSWEKLVITANVAHFDREYFGEEIIYLLELPHVEYIGEINDEQKASFLGNAAARLLPIAWHEPFGLAMIEAMMCGTPVIAMGLGAVPEVVEEGVAGFVVRGEDEAVAAVGRIGGLERARVRETGVEKFGAERMAGERVGLYEEVCARC